MKPKADFPAVAHAAALRRGKRRRGHSAGPAAGPPAAGRWRRRLGRHMVAKRTIFVVTLFTRRCYHGGRADRPVASAAFSGPVSGIPADNDHRQCSPGIGKQQMLHS